MQRQVVITLRRIIILTLIICFPRYFFLKKFVVIQEPPKWKIATDSRIIFCFDLFPVTVCDLEFHQVI